MLDGSSAILEAFEGEDPKLLSQAQSFKAIHECIDAEIPTKMVYGHCWDSHALTETKLSDGIIQSLCTDTYGRVVG